MAPVIANQYDGPCSPPVWRPLPLWFSSGSRWSGPQKSQSCDYRGWMSGINKSQWIYIQCLYLSEAIALKSFRYLTWQIRDKELGTKCLQDIKYEDLKIQPYLCSPLFSRKEQSILFRLRSRTISGIRNDFRGMYFDSILCPVCPPDAHIDTIPNLVTCPTLQEHIKSRGIHTRSLEYEHISSSDVKTQHEATVLFTRPFPKK